jgi:hypothetical protein
MLFSLSFSEVAIGLNANFPRINSKPTNIIKVHIAKPGFGVIRLKALAPSDNNTVKSIFIFILIFYFSG